LGAACIGNFLYAVGGADYGTKYNTLERYDIAADTWTTLSPMPTPREHLAVAVSGGKLHVLGGYRTDRFGSLTTHEIYDPATDRWKKGAPLPLRLCGFAAATLGDEILTFGGEQGWAVVPFVFSYNTKKDMWSRLPDLRAPRYAAAAAECNGAIHVLGGNTRMFSNDFSRHHDVFSR
jgi:N-acetylneuraminic acid mutarotase